MIVPFAEQRQIVARIDQLIALVDELETRLVASSATAKNLLKAVVTVIFQCDKTHLNELFKLARSVN